MGGTGDSRYCRIAQLTAAAKAKALKINRVDLKNFVPHIHSLIGSKSVGEAAKWIG